jgi:CHAT domain-containing protein/Tfp pilus assembly protein PilF
VHDTPYTHRAHRLLMALLSLLLLMAYWPAQAQELQWKQLTEEVAAMQKQGHYAQGLPTAIQAVEVARSTFGAEHPNYAKSLFDQANMYRLLGKYSESEPLHLQALAIREKALGPDHPDVAMSLNDLGMLAQVQGQYAKAEPLGKQALALLEKALGPDHPDVAGSLNNLALLYRVQGQYALAEPLYKRSLAIREKSLGLDHPSVATSLNNLAILYNVQGQYAQAEPLYKRSVAIQDKALGLDHPDVATTLNNIAALHHAQGQYAQAEPLLKRSVAIREKSLGLDHPLLATSLNNLAALYRAQGQYALAEPLFKRSLAIREKALGLDHPDVGMTMSSLGNLYLFQVQYAQAEPLFKRSLAIREKALGLDHPDVATTLINLAALYRAQGQYALAEPLFKRSLAIREKALGLDHPDVGMSLNYLASLYQAQGQYALAEPLFKRSLAILEKALGPDHPQVATSLSNLAALYRAQGQYALAEPLIKRALAIKEKSLGLDHPEVVASLINFAALYQAQGQYALAEPLLKRSVAIKEKSLGLDHPSVATSLHNLAALYHAQGQYAQAEPLFKRALAIHEKSLVADSPLIASSLTGLASLYQAQGQIAPALALSRRASAIYRQRIVAAGVEDSASQEAAASQVGLFRHLSLLALNPEQEPVPNLTDEALQTVQLAQSSGTASAIAKMAARFATGDDALAVLARRKQDAAKRRNKDEAQLVKAASQPPAKRDGVREQRLRESVAQTAKELEAIDAELTQRFPAYQELARPEPVTVAKVQALLRPGEAMLAYGMSDDAYVWVITPKQSSFRALPVKRKDLETQVARVRSQMALDGADQGIKVSVDVLHGLYNSLFAPIVPELAGVTHVMVVPTGPLQSLPFGMLVTAPVMPIKTRADYRKVPWLIKKYAFSVLPSVSSIQAFRQFAKTQQAKGAFVGFGDPVLGTQSDLTRGVRAKLDVAGVFRNVGAATGAGAAGRADIADVDFIRGTPSLPETAGELRNMARILKAEASTVWLQEQATETRVKTMDLSRYRTLAFATHGALAGQVSGAGEPGLLLTPPKVGTLEDDGYLSASEIARLNLNADWVVLSACNTAAADGTPGAEGLSGMAKAFFFAGARSLLVSHWQVATEATVPLTTVMLKEYEAHPKRGKAQAQRKAMLALMNTPGRPEYAHPLYWAPFVVVGEGGAGVGGK